LHLLGSWVLDTGVSVCSDGSAVSLACSGGASRRQGVIKGYAPPFSFCDYVMRSEPTNYAISKLNIY